MLCVMVTFYEYSKHFKKFCFKANLMWSAVQKVEAIPYMAWVTNFPNSHFFMDGR